METSNQARLLPIFKIDDTEFYVDIRLDEFREKDAPWNRISMHELTEGDDNVTALVYDQRTKNVCEDLVDPDNIPSYVKLIIVPPLMELDPVGLARKFGLPDDSFIKDKTVTRSPIKEQKQFIKRKKGRRL